ncbi:MAG: hypothetical protein C4521_10880 [Actinobacteria bacterium]|nr:MAG: hypothetical protein C4521_10880 [Actinomycetota bacterium]
MLAESLTQELKARTQSHSEIDWEGLYQELLGYPPYEKQLIFHKCQADEIMYGGAAGGGKTTTIDMHMIGRARHTPGFHGAIFRRTYPELEGEGSHIPVTRELLAPWVNKGICNYNVSTHRWTFSNGSTISFCHCKDEQDITTYNSIQFAAIAIDEARDWTYHMYTYLLSRLRTNKKIKTQMIIATNPGGRGMPWIRARFVKPPPEVKPDGLPDTMGEVWVPQTLDDEEQRLGLVQLSRAFIQSKVTDNLIMMRNNPRYLMNLRQLPKPTRSMLLDGSWDVYAGQAFQEWRDNEHTCQPFEIPVHWERFRTMDWGYQRPYCVLFWAIDTDSPPPFRLYCYKEFYGWGGEPDKGSQETPIEIAAKIVAFEAQERKKDVIVYPGPADRMIFSRGDDGGPSKAEQMAQLGVTWLQADQSPASRTSSKMLLHWRLKPLNDEPGARPGIVFFRSCVHTIRTLPMLPLDENKPEDIDQKAEDHAYDAVRYAVQYRTPIPEEKPQEKTWVQLDKERLSATREYVEFQPMGLFLVEGRYHGGLFGSREPDAVL